MSDYDILKQKIASQTEIDSTQLYNKCGRGRVEDNNSDRFTNDKLTIQ